MYYVAYGSNLDVKQMAWRCPDAKIVGTGTIKNYKFVFDVHADIRESNGDNVKVLVWDISDKDLISLDMYEGFPVYYIREMIRVDMDDGYVLSGIVYLMNNRHEYFVPSNDYLNVILNSYEFWGFDTKDVNIALEESRNYKPSNKYVCSKCFQTASKCKCKADRHRHWIEIDEPLQKVIYILNKKGYKTNYCCAGHSNKDNTYIYFINKLHSPECNIDGVIWNKGHTAMYYWYNPHEPFKSQQKEFITALEKWAKNLENNPYVIEKNKIEKMYNDKKIKYREFCKLDYELSKKYA